jgi:hypothetical protein
VPEVKPALDADRPRAQSGGGSFDLDTTIGCLRETGFDDHAA